MIVIKDPNYPIILQSQLSDFDAPHYKEITIIKVVLDGSISKTIKNRFRPGRYSRKKHVNTSENNINANHLIIEYFPKNIQDEIRVYRAKKQPKQFVPYNNIKKQCELSNFIDIQADIELNNNVTYLKDVDTQFIDRFRTVNSVKYEDFCKNKISKEEWIFYQEVLEYKGKFAHIFKLNSFKYWDKVEHQISFLSFKPKVFSLKEIIIWDLLRHSLGIENYSKFNDIVRNFDMSALENIFSHHNTVPEPYHFSYYYSFLTPKHFTTFFNKLVAECIKYNIIIPGIAMGDGLFVHSWAGNFKKDKFGNPTDPDASITVHDKKFYGKGFTAIAIYAWCGDRWLPIFFKTYTGHVNENAIFSEVFMEFMAQTNEEWKCFNYDKGGSSKKNRELVKSKNIICIIPARKNIKYEDLIEVGNGRYYCESDIPYGMGLNKFSRLIDHRAQIEAGFSPFEGTYNMKRMNTMGLDAAKIHFSKFFILTLLHALTAYKTNRPDLILSSKAFTAVKV